MTDPIQPKFNDLNLDAIADVDGVIAIFSGDDRKLDLGVRRLNRLSKGAVLRAISSDEFGDLKEGDAIVLPYLPGLAAKSVVLVKLPARPQEAAARKAGATLAKSAGKEALTILAGNRKNAGQIALGAVLRGYEFSDHKSKPAEARGDITVLVKDGAQATADYAVLSAISEGVFMTRDLVNKPANILTTESFADELLAMKELGLKLRVLEEDEMQKLGMDALLGVGRGSVSPSKIVVMEWNGGDKNAEKLALVGKGVVFDTGGISLKPAAGMEDMTMDMGGAGVVAGVMKTLALRKAPANVVGLVGLVENMPDGMAQRPGDVVTSMKGDTIEVINTDAEGRLVLADVLWFAQEEYKPDAVINLATLTGAIIIGLGHDNAGVFSNNEAFSKAFLKSARLESEGAWPMPMDASYDKLIKSRVADIKNTGGRAAGSVTAAKFLEVFVKKDMPWIHLDIAGVASVKSETDLAPAGATGWGVRALDRLVKDKFEPKPE
ncbi:MAG: leucyl aminopeptidase [Halocynthiibacter sp.]